LVIIAKKLGMPSNSRISSACNGCRTKKQKVRSHDSRFRPQFPANLLLQKPEPPIDPLTGSPYFVAGRMSYITTLTRIHNGQCSGDRSVNSRICVETPMSLAHFSCRSQSCRERWTLTELCHCKSAECCGKVVLATNPMLIFNHSSLGEAWLTSC
jgi:hypothetical protein